MGDGLKLAKDKRHRSSSSLSGAMLDGTRSERKLDMNGLIEIVYSGENPSSIQVSLRCLPSLFQREVQTYYASIPELDDHFASAEARCDNLQEKIDLIKSLKRKKKLKKRSTTRVTEPPAPESLPFISVRTQPKKKVSQQSSRLRRLEVPPNPTRGYLDPATVEQHRMLGQVRGYNQAFKNPQQERIGLIPTRVESRPYSKLRRQRSQADGDSMCSQCVQITNDDPIEVACGQDEIGAQYSNYDEYDRPPDYSVINAKKPMEKQKQSASRRRHVPKDSISKEDTADQWRNNATGELPVPRRRPTPRNNIPGQNKEERPVVELFNKSRTSPTDLRRQNASPSLPQVNTDKKTKKSRSPYKFDDQDGGLLENVLKTEQKKDSTHHPRRVKYRSRRYELPTVASQMKQAGMRYYYGNSNHTNIPFVISKSTAPSHNIGVNIQQVLNGLKIQQPLSGIPLTIAHHMGLGHVPTYGVKSTVSQQPSLDHREINSIRVGRKLLRLPSYKYMSYNRLLSLYREGDGMVPRFLRAISRPHYFYTSMYNLAINREDFDGATSKGRGGSQEAKQSLAEYASLYREYEQIDKCIKEGNYEPELERRREELTKELAAREGHIRRVVQEYRAGPDLEPTLRASASTADDGYRHSAFKMGDPQQ